MRLSRAGRIDFVGRRDTQIKLRGHRIELGEIEARLARRPGVAEAAVVVADAGDELIAYVRPRSAEALRDVDLRAELEHELPRWMLPRRILVDAELPRTASGKLDRRALARRVTAESISIDPRPRVAPRNALERELVDLWSGLLERSDIGVRDDFFELGGHSLLATQLVARIERRFSRALSVETIFDAPTIERLAQRLDPDASSANPSATQPSETQTSRAASAPDDDEQNAADPSSGADAGAIRPRTRKRRERRKLDAEVHR